MPFPTIAEVPNTIPEYPKWDTSPGLVDLRVWGPWVTAALLALEAKLGADSSAVPASHDYQVARTGILASVEVDHADSSPKVILPAGTRDKKVLILVTATEAAGGEPDIDIGQRGNVNKFMDDIGVGVWPLGFAAAVIGNFAANAAMRATIASAGSAGKLLVTVIELPDRT